MKKLVVIILVVFVGNNFLFSQIKKQLILGENCVSIEKLEGYDKILSDEYIPVEVGYPELPSYIRSYVIPIHANNVSVVVNGVSKRKLQGEYTVFPTQPPIPTNGEGIIQFIKPKQQIYESENAFPGKYVELISDRIFLGYRIVDVRIYPYEYIPKAKELYVCDIDYSVEYAMGQNALSNNTYVSYSQSQYLYEQNKKLVKFMVDNPEDVDNYDTKVKNIVRGKNIDAGKNSFNTALMPFAPEYILITADSLVESFEPFVEWKRKKGIYTVIQTVEDIALNYQGNDLQDKIRNYIIHSKEMYGEGKYVLLGGDNNIIPARLVQGDYDSDGSNHNNLFAADLYYASYKGTWNGNGNNKYNEWVLNNSSGSLVFGNHDNTDYSVGAILGRLPIKNKQEISIITNKIIQYEKAEGISDAHYFKNYLYSDAYMGNSGSRLTNFGIKQIKDTVNKIIPNFNNKYICDNADCTGASSKYSTFGANCSYGNNGDIELNGDNLFNALNTGADLGIGKFHFIYHMDHCKAQAIGASSKDKGGSVTMHDMKNLTNGPYYQIFMSGGCNTANFMIEEGVSKSYLFNSNGGGVAWIGNTDHGWTTERYQFGPFLRLLHKNGKHDLGSAYLSACERYYTGNNCDSKWRLHLLGDPEMQVWTDTPKSMAVTVNPTTTIPCGENTVTVNVQGIQPADEEVRICLYKKDEVFEPLTVQGNGTYTFERIHPVTPGELYVTVTAHNYLPVEDTLTVTANPNQHIRFKGMTIDDDDAGESRGNGNEQIEAGDTIELVVELENNGLTAARGVKANISSASPYVTITTAQADYGTIAAGQTKTSQSKYVIQTDKDMPEILRDDPRGIVFVLDISDADGNAFTDSFGVDVFADSLQMRNRSFTGNATPVAGQPLRFNIDLQNLGKTTAVGVTATLKDAAGNTVCTRSYPLIARNETAQATAVYEYTVPANYTSGALNMTLAVENKYGKTWTFPLNLAETRLPAVTGVDFTADLTSINLHWDVQTDVAGYNIYRCDVDGNDLPTGNYTKLNTGLLSFAYYQDTGLEQLTKYHYRIAAVSHSGLEGVFAEKTAWTSLQEKGLFPVKMEFDGMRGGINAVDVNNDGKKELFSSSRKGYLAGLDCEGNELYDIDNNVTTYSGFVKFGIQCDAMPSIGDLYGDGKMRIVQPTRFETGDKINQLFCFSPEDVSPHNQRPDTVWHVFTDPLNAIALRPAVLANIDNSLDGSLEIIVPYENRIPANTYCIVAYNADGTERLRLNWPGGYSAIAVADLNGDGTKEIIAATQTGVTAWDCQGNTVWNFVREDHLFNASVTVCDLEGDGEKEVLTIMLNRSSKKAKIIALNAQGEEITGWKTPEMPHDDATYIPSLSVGDLNHDGHLEVVVNGEGYIGIWDCQGNEIKVIDDPLASQNFQNPILADVDSEPDVEIIVSSTTGPYLLAYKMDGRKVLGFPLTVEDNVHSIPTVCDADNDGKNEIILSCNDRIHMWKTEGKPENIEWGMERHNPQNTGEYTAPCLSEHITANTVWTEDKTICGDLTVYPGNSLTIKDCTINFGSTSTLTVHPDATLEIDAATLQHISIDAKPGSSLKISGNGKIHLREGGVFETGKGTLLEMGQGEIQH